MMNEHSSMMMDGMMNGPMMWAMGTAGVLVAVLFVLAAAALVKYLLAQRQNERGNL